ncbi:hypothetical protein Taro_047765 [Colocasia esculenta]|uniref:Receptor-like serine/threonine-protein kinase n=1 Tax=Colocasia esculenta TaxID=4460 RepID=A0A843WWV7_COLES|nr:hypothetical protein [Colocasia esculenta]
MNNNSRGSKQYCIFIGGFLSCALVASMARCTSKTVLLSLFLLLLLLFSSMPCFRASAGAADTITLGRSIAGNQTVVSKGGVFEMGFFTPGTSHNHYLGIWYKGIPLTVVWVANGEAPIMETSYPPELKISKDGNLVITSKHHKLLVWSSNLTVPHAASTMAVLLDTGNLLLTDSSNPSAVLWQSFDHPTDTWLPTARLGLNKATGVNHFITSWRNHEDPAPGTFSLMLDGGGSSELFLVWNKTERYWRSGNWTGSYFSLLPEMKAYGAFNFTFVDDKRGKYGSFPQHPTILGRATIEMGGQVKFWIWASSLARWLPIWSAPSGRCTVYAVCGAFSVCDEKTTLVCRCLDGFEPASVRDWELGNWSGGCLRRASLQCPGNTSMNRTPDGFLALPNVQLRDTPQTLSVQRAKECEAACLSSCNCSAYSFHGGCSIWAGELLNLQQLSEDDNMGVTLFLRLAPSELARPNRKNRTMTKLITVISVPLGIVMLVSVAMGIAWWHRRRTLARIEAESIVGSLVQLTYSELKAVTKNFSEMLGKGGFGSVYKGVLHGSTPVAVKRLEGHGQGEKQFRSELSTLGTVQHVNLVSLRGFCVSGSERLLVYDYMPHGSLDVHLFQNNSLVGTLSWKRRFQVMLGVARGLAYLHESCSEQIIHCDIKPENILLDAEFCAKVADFGLAKLFGRDFSRVLTTMRGTVGYLAPEWISGTAITTKADVYSYGMMAFEIISGRRNGELLGDGEFNFFPVQATAKVCEGDVLSIADGKLEDIDMEELTRASRVACWCIQDHEIHRPSMGVVVKILEGSVDVGAPPVPRFLQLLV